MDFNSKEDKEAWESFTNEDREMFTRWRKFPNSQKTKTEMREFVIDVRSKR